MVGAAAENSCLFFSVSGSVLVEESEAWGNGILGLRKGNGAATCKYPRSCPGLYFVSR
jgi:hypothetical protein